MFKDLAKQEISNMEKHMCEETICGVCGEETDASNVIETECGTEVGECCHEFLIEERFSIKGGDEEEIFYYLAEQPL